MTRNSRENATGRHAIAVSAALLVFAVFLLLDPFSFSSPVAPRQPTPEWATDTTPVRQPSSEPIYEASVFRYRCSDCHKIIPPPADRHRRTPTQHTEIVLHHGINTSCFNCHHPVNRDAFVDDFGNEIPWDKPQLVCAKCHGPVYRDWQHGSHGRTNGYWDETRGTQSRRKCVECHDPHQPPFRRLKPAPAPNTLRMGRQEHPHETTQHTPLRLRRSTPIGSEAGAAGEDH